MYRRFLLIALLGLSLSACAPYYGGSGYYSSDVYSSPAPAYYGGGSSYYSTDRSYYAPRYYQPAPRYYQPAPRYYQPPRAAYRPYPNQGWGGHERPRYWNNQDGGGHGSRDNHGRGDHGRGGRGH
ncbi:hypothetical protein GV819_19370 [Pseudomonas sp. Fl5BN2]|uniref:hypothetical protein n=1 Tax=unclassified Pseudomonas TaxID=196821 RepID=UPI001377B939|nr:MULTISPECIES: hypothetical protein [unclassified Pseudomonas]NBF04446.1 hypothetical protein [Pseudomonas sp. Fl5BN2]NBF10724.1 hypothetical protein [Pseudomonas sp. Fl4BN1]